MKLLQFHVKLLNFYLFSEMVLRTLLLLTASWQVIYAQIDPYERNTQNNGPFTGNEINGNNYDPVPNSGYNTNYNYNNNLDPNRNYNVNNVNFSPGNTYFGQNFGGHLGSYGNVEELKCPEYWVQFQNSCYRFIKSPLKPYNEARRICQVSCGILNYLKN